MSFSLEAVCNCVKRLHPDLRHRVGSDTIKKYEKSLDSFTMYLHRQPDWTTFSSEDIDFLAMEFRTEMDLTKSTYHPGGSSGVFPSLPEGQVGALQRGFEGSVKLRADKAHGSTHYGTGYAVWGLHGFKGKGQDWCGYDPAASVWPQAI